MGKDFLRLGYQRGAAFGDLNNDGFEDIVVTSLNQSPRILMNSADNGNHWLVLELTGRQSNRDAIGAKVKLVTASGRILYNHVSVSVGFISSSDKRVYFGLGAEKEVELHRDSLAARRRAALNECASGPVRQGGRAGAVTLLDGRGSVAHTPGPRAALFRTATVRERLPAQQRPSPPPPHKNDPPAHPAASAEPR